jgi:hypothetical protein
MEHTSKCIQAQKEFEQRLKDFAKQYPKYCTNCHATGLKMWGDGAFEDTCRVCFDDGFCPRCGESFIFDVSISSEAFYHRLNNAIENRLPCENCGWQWGKDKNDFAPQYECYGECNQHPLLSSFLENTGNPSHD